MKTTKVLSAISIALIILGTAAFAGNNPGSNNSGNIGSGIRFEVKIHLDKEIAGNNSYIVQLLDEHARPVGPAQTYVKGISVYTFYEWGPKTGVRIARMIPAPNIDHFAGLPNLFCKPDIKTGTFDNRQTYTFDLYPSTTPPDKE